MTLSWKFVFVVPFLFACSTRPRPGREIAGGHDTEGAEAPAKSDDCYGADTKIPDQDLMAIAQYFSKVGEMSYANGGKILPRQNEELITKYLDPLSKNGKDFFLRRSMQLRLDAMVKVADDPKLEKDFANFSRRLGEHFAARQKYHKEGVYNRFTGRADQRLQDSGNRLARAGNFLLRKVSASKKLSAMEKNLVTKQILHVQSQEFQADGDVAEAYAEKYGVYAAQAEVTANLFGGVALLGMGMMTFGSSAGIGAAALARGAHLGTTLLINGAKVGVKALSGRAMTEGYIRARDSLGRGARAALDQERSFGCSLGLDFIQTGHEVRKNAVAIGNLGAFYTGTFGIGLLAGHTARLITLGITGSLSVSAVGFTIAHVLKSDKEAARYFFLAQQAADKGDMEMSKKYLREGQSHAVDTGLYGVDLFFAFLATQHALSSLRREMNYVSRHLHMQFHPDIDPAVTHDGVSPLASPNQN